MIGNRAARKALTGANRLTWSPPPSTLRVQLTRSAGGAPEAHQGHPARTYGGDRGHAAIHAAAARGVATPWTALPHARRIQHSFGHHDISSIQAHVGDTAAASATEMHADAYTTGTHVVLGKGTDLFTVAHEAAHVVQQRAGVQLKGGVGAAGDPHERHADAVAARVTAGQSAEALLDTYAGRSAAAPQIQCRTHIVDDPSDAQNAAARGTGRGLLKDSAGNIHDDVIFGPLRDDCGTFMEAWINANDYDPQGTVPQSGAWPNWWAAAAPKDTRYWVRGHLLNEHLGGPGEKRNLTPITKKANSEHSHSVEEIVKHAAAQGGVGIGYQVEAIYNGTGPTGLNGDAYDPDPSVWSKLALGFKCEYTFLDDAQQVQSFRVDIENRR